MPPHARPERRTGRVYLREAVIWGFAAGGVYAAAWWLTKAEFFSNAGIAGLIAALGLGAAIGLTLEWQLYDDPDGDE